MRSLREYLELELNREMNALDSDGIGEVCKWIQDDEGVDLVDFMGEIAQDNAEQFWRIQQLQSCLWELQRLTHLAEQWEAIKMAALVVKGLFR